jgi:hypothetical protein
MPWVTLPRPVTVAGFRFVPIQTSDPAPVVGSEIASTAAQAIRTHVDQRGKPIEKCTIVLRTRHAVAWDIPGSMWSAANRAAEILALSCLAEQRFLMGHFSPHLNATMFRLVGQGVTVGADGIGLTYPRRGQSLRALGWKFKDLAFQQPPQIEGTGCEVVNLRLAKALHKARSSNSPVWEPIASSLKLFLLGHAEMPDLGWDTCVMISAMAFERLLEPAQTSAQVLAETFALQWAAHASQTIAQARRVKPDPNPTWAATQRGWPIHRKWMKELYEARSSQAHRGSKSSFSRNWADGQHMVIAAYVYPLTVKLRLASAGLYQLDDEEQVACDTLDKLLDSDWERDPPEWPTILSEAETIRAFERIELRELEQAEKRARAREARRIQRIARPAV